MINILHVVGTRPNFIKVAPVMAALAEKSGITQMLIHTGQHHEFNMSEIFFRDLDIHPPDMNLGIGRGSQTTQTAKIMLRLEKCVAKKRPDLTLVYGDVTSSLSAALVCAKTRIPLGHVEAGMRSGDRSMPEEINRLLIDQMADLLFAPSEEARNNLIREGIAAERIHVVGNVLIDTLVRLHKHARLETVQVPEQYGVVTLHRPSNVDEPKRLGEILEALIEISIDIPVIFPVHPRTRQKIRAAKIKGRTGRLSFIEPVGYLEFLALQKNARLVVTDSGGVQAEATYLGIPCVIVRDRAEGPGFISRDVEHLRIAVRQILEKKWESPASPSLWDGNASQRIATVIETSNAYRRLIQTFKTLGERLDHDVETRPKSSAAID